MEHSLERVDTYGKGLLAGKNADCDDLLLFRGSVGMIVIVVNDKLGGLNGLAGVFDY